jgi:hypothetical protein
MVKINDSLTVAVTTETDLFTVPSDYVAYLTRLIIANDAFTVNTIIIRYYNDTSSKVVSEIIVGALDEIVVLDESKLPEEGAPTKITVEGSQAPYTVSYTVDLR